MDENYIDKKLKGILESSPEYKPEESEVNDMRKKLREIQNPKQRRPILPLLWPLLFLPVLIGGLFFYKKYEKLEQAFIELNKQVTANQIHTRDSIFEKQIIYKFDTIYNVIYKVKYISEEREEENNFQSGNYNSSTYSSLPMQFSRGHVSQRFLDWSLGNNRPSLFATLPNSGFFKKPHLWDEELESIAARNVYSDPLLLETISLSLLNAENNIGKQIDLEDQLLDTPERKINPKYFFIPSGFRAGVKYGPTVFPINEYSSSAKSIGVSGTIEFPRNQRLEIGAEWFKMSFEVKDDPVAFAKFPIEDPRDPTDNLHELKVSFTYLQIPITFRQSFRRNKKFQPMMSAGLVAYRPLKNNFIYEYIDGSGEYKLSAAYRNGSFSADNLRLGLGAEYFIRDKISANFEVQYQHGFSEAIEEYFPLRYWGLNLGIDYLFE